MAKKKLTDEEKEMISNERKKRVDKVFIWILVLFVICGIGYASFIMYKNGGIKFLSNNKKEVEKNKKEEENATTIKEVKVDGNLLYFDNYILEVENYDKLIALYDLDGKVIKEYSENFTFDNNIYAGKNGELYSINYEYGDDYTNNAILYDLTSKKDSKVLELDGSASYFTALYYDANGKNHNVLIGFVETIFKDNGDENYKIHYLNGDVVDLGSYQIDSISPRLDTESPIKVLNDKYSVVINYNKTNSKYGVVDLKTGDLVIDCNYNLLFQADDNTFVAKMDGKTGLIDLKTKKELPYEYDFIAPSNGFFVVGKDNKLAIVDDKYKFVTDFNFDYQTINKGDSYSYRVCCANFNTFHAIKIDDKYLLTINVNSALMDIDYNKDEAYIISSDGTYETIKEHDFGVSSDLVYFYDIDNKLISLYDGKLEHVSDISLKDYDIPNDSILDINKYEDVIVVKSGGMRLYFDYNTGEELDEPIAHYTYNNLAMDINFEDKTIKFLKDKKEVKDIDKKIDLESLEINKLKDGGYVVLTDKRFIIMK